MEATDFKVNVPKNISQTASKKKESLIINSEIDVYFLMQAMFSKGGNLSKVNAKSEIVTRKDSLFTLLKQQTKYHRLGHS